MMDLCVGYRNVVDCNGLGGVELERSLKPKRVPRPPAFYFGILLSRAASGLRWHYSVGRYGTYRRNSTASCHRGFTLIEMLVVIGIVGLLTTLTLPAVLTARAASRRMTCASHLREMGIALHSHHTQHGRFPPRLDVVRKSGPVSVRHVADTNSAIY